MNPKTILALDTSTTHVGMSIWEGDLYITGCERAYPGRDIFHRVLAIRDDVARWAQDYRTEIVVVERPIYDPRHGPDTLAELSIPFAAIGLWCTEHGIRFEMVYPTSAKAALGNARASKDEMIRLAQIYIGYTGLGLGEHHADSIGVFAAFWSAILKPERLEAMAT